MFVVIMIEQHRIYYFAGNEDYWCWETSLENAETYIGRKEAWERGAFTAKEHGYIPKVEKLSRMRKLCGM